MSKTKLINMKKITLLLFFMSLLVLGINAQNLEVQGKAKIMEMDTVTDISANVVRQSDGTLALRQYKIGDFAQGGIIFYIDESGEHGLVADTADLSTGIRWYAGTYGTTQAKGDGPFSGEMNTAIIISSHVAIGDDGTTYAARMCADLQKGGYSDWYLPSKEELSLMYSNLHQAGLGGFAADFYWSSSEFYNLNAWGLFFNNGNQDYDDKNYCFRVRAARAF
jgi:hypothetical protein